MINKLDDLVIDGGELVREVMVEILFPYISFTKEGELLLKNDFEGLSATNKVIIVYLSLKAMNALGFKETSGAGPKAISEISGIPGGTVRRYVRELEDEKILKSEGGLYEVPLYSLEKIKKIFTRKEERDG